MVIQMIAVGEESGSLDEMSGKVATFYEAEVDNAVDAMSSLLEPLIMAILGGARRWPRHRDVPAHLQTGRRRLIELFAASPALFLGTVFVLGLIVGSFLNVVIYRVPIMLNREWRAQCAELAAEDAAAAAPAAAATGATAPAPSSARVAGDAKPPSASTSWSHGRRARRATDHIRAIENIPLVSWLALRGQVRRLRKGHLLTLSRWWSCSRASCPPPWPGNWGSAGRSSADWCSPGS